MLSSYVYQLVFLSCISVLTLMTAVVGRLSLVTVFKLTVVFQFLWNLNFFLHVYICVVRNGNLTLPYVFDSFGSSYVYLFAACFGIAFTVLINRQRIPSNRNNNRRSNSRFCSSIHLKHWSSNNDGYSKWTILRNPNQTNP